MANKELAFSIKVLGSDKQATEIGKIEAELADLSKRRRELNKQLKETIESQGSESKSAKQLGTALADVKNQSKQLRTEQRQLLKSSNSVEGSYNALSSETSRLRARMKDLNLANKEEFKEYQRLEKQVASNNQALKDLDARVNIHSRNVGNYSDALKGAERTLESIEKEVKDLRQAQSKLNLSTEKGKKEFRGYQDQINKAEKELKDLRKGTIQTQTQTGKLSGFLKNSVGPAIVGAFAVGSVIAFTKRIITLNAEMSDFLANVRKTTGLTQQGVEDLRKELGRINTRTSMQGLLEIAEGAGRLGIAEEELAGFVETVDKAVVSLGDDLGGNADQIASDLGTIAGVFGEDERLGTAEALNSIGSAINELGANSRAQAGAIVDITSRLQGFADTADISVQNVLGLASSIDNLGLRSESSSTAIGQFLVAMGQDIPKFAEIADLSIEEFSKILREDAVEAMLLVLEGSESASGGLEGLAKQLEELGVEGARQGQTLTTLARNTEDVRKQVALSNDAYEKATSLSEEFDVKNNTLAGSLDKLNKTFNSLLTGSSGLSDAIKLIVDIITESLGIFDAWGKGLKQIAATISTVQGVAEPLTRLDFGGFIDNIANIGNRFDTVYDNLTLSNEAFQKQRKEITDQIAVYKEKTELTEEEAIELEVLRLTLQKLTFQRKLERAERDRDAEAAKEAISAIKEITGWIQEENEKIEANTAARRNNRKKQQKELEERLKFIKHIEQLEQEFALSQKSELEQQIGEINKRYNEEIKAAKEANVTKEDIARLETLRQKEISLVRQKAREEEIEHLRKLENNLQKVQDKADEFWRNWRNEIAEAAKERRDQERQDVELFDVDVREEQDVADPEGGAAKKAFEEQKKIDAERKGQLKTAAIESAQAIADAQIQIKRRQIEQEKRLQLNKLQDEKQTELTSLETRLRQGLITEEQFRKKKEEVDKEFQEKQRKLEEENFERQKKQDIKQALIAGALAAARALATPPAPNFIAAGAAATGAAAQVAVIKNQEFPKAEHGEMFEIGGKRHSQGGTKFVGSDGSSFEAEEGELMAIVNRRSTDMLRNLSDINVAGGGKQFFRQGGINPPSPVNLNNNINLPNQGNQKVYILESEITGTQKKVRNIQSNASV